MWRPGQRWRRLRTVCVELQSDLHLCVFVFSGTSPGKMDGSRGPVRPGLHTPERCVSIKVFRCPTTTNTLYTVN